MIGSSSEKFCTYAYIDLVASGLCVKLLINNFGKFTTNRVFNNTIVFLTLKLVGNVWFSLGSAIKRPTETLKRFNYSLT